MVKENRHVSRFPCLMPLDWNETYAARQLEAIRVVLKWDKPLYQNLARILALVLDQDALRGHAALVFVRLFPRDESINISFISIRAALVRIVLTVRVDHYRLDNLVLLPFQHAANAVRALRCSYGLV